MREPFWDHFRTYFFLKIFTFLTPPPEFFLSPAPYKFLQGAQPKSRYFISRNIRRSTRFHLWDHFLIFWGPPSESTLRWTPSIDLRCFQDIPFLATDPHMAPDLEKFLQGPQKYENFIYSPLNWQISTKTLEVKASHVSRLQRHLTCPIYTRWHKLVQILIYG